MVIASMNNKGGVGKTASTGTIAQVLAIGDYKVLVIDMDQQGNCSRLFGIDSDVEGLDYAKLFCERISKEEAYNFIYQSNFKNIHILPASHQLIDMPIILYEEDKNNPAALLNFKKNIEAIAEDYDIVLIDTPPGYDKYYTRSLLMATDKIIVPSEVDNASYEGVSNLVPLVKEVNDKYCLNIEFAGVFFTRVKERCNLFKSMNDSYAEIFGEYFLPVSIRDTIAMHESYTAFVPLYFWDRKCTAFRDYVELVGVLGIMDKAHWKHARKALEENIDMRAEEEE